jgi:hypothetical protein
VNIVDLVQAQGGGKLVKTFNTAKALAKYIKKTGKIYPRERAKRNPLLRQFLINVSQAAKS